MGKHYSLTSLWYLYLLFLGSGVVYKVSVDFWLQSNDTPIKSSFTYGNTNEVNQVSTWTV